MYMECRAGERTGEARIGRLTFSRTGKTLYYRDRKFQSMEASGLGANYYDLDTREEYRIADCRPDGADRADGKQRPVEIDEDAREEYWTEIRGLPGNKD